MGALLALLAQAMVALSNRVFVVFFVGLTVLALVLVGGLVL